MYAQQYIYLILAAIFLALILYLGKSFYKMIRNDELITTNKTFNGNPAGKNKNSPL
ncbi:hypothetical protein [Bacillus testis]|uniref:hypothetical protein n=1 Tax=Bacillus testis TaxID=1622072 RepID=UPI000B175990|nr:hypothetical protein [Bacillus testis]